MFLLRFALKQQLPERSAPPPDPCPVGGGGGGGGEGGGEQEQQRERQRERARARERASERASESFLRHRGSSHLLSPPPHIYYPTTLLTKSESCRQGSTRLYVVVRHRPECV